LKISNKGIQLIKNFEGERLVAYQDSVGVWTIGVGHTGNVDGKAICKGMRITSEKSLELLKEDIFRFEKAVNNTKLNLNQNQFDALVSFSFNCGVGSLTTLIKNRTLQEIGDALLLYNKAGGKVLQGLVNRRTKERELFFTKVETLIDTPVEAISVLRNKGVIVEPDKWYDGTWKDEDFKWLLIKFASYISKVEKPAEAISLMVDKGIIVEPDKWYDGTWKSEDFKWLLIKMANYIV
jgi:lysozyme